jgi:hypothetical protein
MRNYVAFFFTKWVETFPQPDLVFGYGMGADQAMADGRAQTLATFHEQGTPGATWKLISLGKIYCCLEKFSLLGYFTGGQLQQDGDTLAFVNFQAFNAAIGLGDGNSPKHSSDFPTSDGKAFKAGVSGSGKGGGTLAITLAAYLALLFNTWISGAVAVPARWIDWLGQLEAAYLAGKLTPSQVYGFLSLVDFSAATPKIL